METFLQPLTRALVRGEAVVGGVLSGTSADGIDVALTRFDAELRPELCAFQTVPFEDALHRRVRRVLDGEEPGLAETARLQRDLGCAFGAAARGVAQQHGLPLDLVGSHGQTVWHHDGNEPSSQIGQRSGASLQLGDGDWLAREAGCPVVVDFRQGDLAAGGEGAPLVSILDEVLFAEHPGAWAVLNLGGMANLTCHGPPARAFDVGPAGSLLDGLARHYLGRSYDEGGAAAARGEVCEAWVSEALAHPFFAQTPPKSTGRDTFGSRWVAGLAASWGPGPAEHRLASASEAVARSVSEALGNCDELFVAGGGVHNRDLFQRLGSHIDVPVRSLAEGGIDPDAREGLLFALLAARWLLGRPSTQSWATGATSGWVLGRLCPGLQQSSRFSPSER